jgi:hypothetical protein
MSKISWRQVSALALAAFFVAGSLGNILAPPSIYAEYLLWGYPRWFHFVTGSLELTTAVLLARAQTRLWGSALGCTVMLAALATVTLHGEYGHGVAPLVAAALSVLVGWIGRPRRSQMGMPTHFMAKIHSEDGYVSPFPSSVTATSKPDHGLDADHAQQGRTER